MILADKIIALRKKNGYSQEELAEKMNVSRQSVSKWEGAQSVPDLNKIIALSKIFGVSTDYLLKDEIEEPEVSDSEDSGSPLRSVSMEEANSFLEENSRYSTKMAVGVFLCIFGLISAVMMYPLSKETGGLMGGIGIAGTLLFIAVAVGIFISSGSTAKKYKYLEKEPIDTAYGVSGMVSERKAAFEAKHRRSLTAGVMLWFLGLISMAVLIVPDIWAAGERFIRAGGVCALLLFGAAGTFMLVKASLIMTGFD